MPPHSVFKACFVKLATTYNLFPEKTKKKTIKDWASKTGGDARALGVHALSLAARSTSSRSVQIRLIKKCIHEAYRAVAPPGSQERPEDMARMQLNNTVKKDMGTPSPESSSSETTPKSMQGRDSKLKDDNQGLEVGPEKMDRLAALRQANKERQPLLPDSIKLDASLVHQVESVVAAGNSGDPDPDLVAAQNKVLRAVQGQKRPAASEGGEKPKKPRAKAKARGKAAAKAKAKADVGDNEDKESENDEERVEPEAPVEPEVPVAPEAPGAAVGEEGEGGDEEDIKPEKKLRGLRNKTPDEVLVKAWEEKEPVLLEAGIPIPDDYVPRTKSYTLPSPTEEGHSVQILWFANQIYCNGFKEILPGCS